MRAFLLLMLLAATPAALAETLHGRVVGIADGDTLTLLVGREQHRIRLADIDAPESKQAFGARSKQSLSDLAFGRDATAVCKDTDRYRRLVCRITVNGTDVNAEQVRRGMAWVYRKYSHDPALLALEADAKQARVGLWSDPSPIPPWEFRHADRKSGR